ncbi:P1 family peptidase [Ornithinimicrobium pratense]|uniref:P1 family peptidase n=1 Tax=Ornithinimicrobium pratense TaxID=2593973 RepID=A0A5J6V7X5_9MICO|nr:P1 family peptidase [Ornithinimicrobium pratense]QFG69667.1 P1 family peptidase [Ornithinimicrobium pratense]
MSTWNAGPRNALTDVAGLAVGHHQRTGDGWLTGTTVILAPPEGAVGGVDVRGGGPGTRETALLDPRNLVERVHAVTLTGGSAFGLAAADGVMRRLYAEGRGFPMGGPGRVVPIVPGAVVFDLGRGGDFDNFPGPDFGEAACSAALQAQSAGEQPVLAQGSVGAGTGTQAGGLRGGVGSASVVIDGAVTVSALVVVNAVGSAVDPATGELWGARHLLEADVHGIPGWPDGALPSRPDAEEVESARRAAAETSTAGAVPRTLATTIGVVATDATLTKAQCARLASSGHDGMARGISPIHTMFDGDTLFGLSTASGPAPDPATFHQVLHAAGEVVTRAIVRALLAAESVTTPAGTWRSYRDAFPGAAR